MKALAAGPLRKRLTIQRNASKDYPESKDVNGQETENWVAVSCVWGSVTPLVGEELFVAQQTLPQVTHEIKVRYFPNFPGDYRITLGSRVFNIRPPRNTEERNIEYRILAIEVPQ